MSKPKRECFVTPEERQELRRAARAWPKDRRRVIAEFIAETIDDCPKCGRPVRRNDPRANAGVEHHTDERGYVVERFRVGHLYCIIGRGNPPPTNLEPL